MSTVKDKVVTLEEAVARIPEGASVAIGGAVLRRKPMALVRALVNRSTSDLTLWTWIGGLDVDLLVSAGMVSAVNSAYVGFGPLGLAPLSRRAFADGSVRFRDWSESSFVAAIRAGGQRLPFALTRALAGTSLAEGLAVELVSPFDGHPVHAVPAAQIDVALLHAQTADPAGNVRRGLPVLADDIDHLLAAAAASVIVSVEEVVSRESTRAARHETVIPGNLVSAVCVAARGAHPTGCDGFYDPDLGELRRYLAATKDPGALESYLERGVRGVSHAEYCARLDDGAL